VDSTQSGVDSITRSLALEWGADYDIRVNGIAPGTIGETPAMKKLAAEKMGKELRELMPLIKFGEKWDVAMAAIYLASNAGWKMRRSSLLFQPYLSQDQVPSISLSEGYVALPIVVFIASKVDKEVT
jgi:2,4-dienoyl-CoA reductase [(3E)-enoyl-CoA-producing], peroxisomal